MLAVLNAARSVATVIVDLPRSGGPAYDIAVDRCDSLVLITPATVRPVTAAAMIARQLPMGRALLVLRGRCRQLTKAQIASCVGLPVFGTVPEEPGARSVAGLNANRLRRASANFAAQLLRAAEQAAARGQSAEVVIADSGAGA